MPEKYSKNHDQYLKNYSSIKVKHIIGIGRETIGKRKDGSEFPIDLSVSEYSINGSTKFTGIIRDISKLKSNQFQFQKK